MPKIRSNLSSGGFAIVVIAFVNLFLLVCIFILLGLHRSPVYGMRISPAESHFVMGMYDRSMSHVITVTPGDPPRFFLEENELPGGMDGVEPLLKEWDCSAPSRVTVILVCDRAVPAGVIQKIADMVLMHGFRCTISGIPPKD